MCEESNLDGGKEREEETKMGSGVLPIPYPGKLNQRKKLQTTIGEGCVRTPGFGEKKRRFIADLGEGKEAGSWFFLHAEKEGG